MSWTNRTDVRLEVGIAHRCNVDEADRVNIERTNVDLNGFSHVVPVGDAHL